LHINADNISENNYDDLVQQPVNPVAGENLGAEKPFNSLTTLGLL
ncbi:9782_t:CDS:1, partial [Cetraspora pellucida]